MPFKGILKAGDSLKITLQNRLDSSGVAIIDVGWTAAPGQQVPAIVQDSVTPGSTDEVHQDTVPPGATRLVVDVALPDTGGATLQVTSGQNTWTATLTGDTSWLFTVVKK